MAKNSYPEELLASLQEYLTDGVITAKEREVLLKKAEKLGVDRDEFDLYIDAQQQKIDQTAQAASNRLRGTTCPYCGGSVQQMADKCPHCGEAITVEASNELKEIIDALESSLVDLKTNVTENAIANVERYMRKAELYYSNNPKVKKLVAEVKIEMETAKEEWKVKASSQARKEFLRKYLVHIIFAVVLLIEVIIAIRYNSLAESTQQDYDNWVGSRSATYHAYQNYQGDFFLMILAIIGTIAFWIFYINKKSKKSDKD
jgi:uncharacterized OB-fold protein